MSPTSQARGHPIMWDGEAWRYVDDGALAEDWGGEARPCTMCHEMPTAEGYDPCLGFVPGAVSVCCGPWRVRPHDEGRSLAVPSLSR